MLEVVDGGDAVDDAVGADLGGVVGEDGDAGAGAGLDEEGLDVEVELDGAAEGGVERRDDGGDGDAGDVGEVEGAEGEEVAEEDAELVEGEVARVVMRQSARRVAGWVAGCGEGVEAEDGVGVADVDG